MPASEIQKFELNRRYATIIAILFDARASIIDEIIELNDKILGSILIKQNKVTILNFKVLVNLLMTS